MERFLGNRKGKDEEGSVVILVAVLMVVFLGMAALVVDLGADYLYKAKMQTACDTASRAAASALPDTTKATELAKYYMKENGFEDTSNVQVEFQDSNSKVQVYLKEERKTTFARALGIKSNKISTVAVAQKYGTSTTETKKIGAIFDFLLFQGSDDIFDTLGSGSQYIYGAVHANGDIKLSGSVGAIGGFSQSSDTFTVNSPCNLVKKNDESGEYEIVGNLYTKWGATNSVVIQRKGSSDTEILKNTEFYTKQSQKIDMPNYILDNVDKILPEKDKKTNRPKLPEITNFSGWKVISSNLNSSITDGDVHYTGSSADLKKSHTGKIVADKGINITTDGAARGTAININGDVYSNSNTNIIENNSGKIVINGNLYVNGDLKFESACITDVIVNGNIFCTGKITTSGQSFVANSTYVYCDTFQPGNQVIVNGTLVAENDITFTGSGNALTGSTAVVSKHGNVNMTAGSQGFNGIVYVPEGTATFGGESAIYGNIIAKNINASSSFKIYPLKDKTIEDLYDSVLKDDSGENKDLVVNGVRLVK